MSVIVTVAGLVFVVSVSGVVYVWENGVGRDAGPPEAVMLVGGLLGAILSLVLFGVAVGLMIERTIP